MKKHVMKLILDLYNYHDYKINIQKLEQISEFILEIGVESQVQIDSFFKNVKLGKHGVFYNNPTCLTHMYYSRHKNSTVLPY